MIVRTKLGVLVSGTLAREPVIKTLSGKDVLILNVKAQSEKDEAGHWKSLFVDVQCWNGIDLRDGMYQKGDFLAAFGREVKHREYPEGSGKFFYSLSADGILPGDMVTLRWMQQVVDMIPDAPTPALSVMAETNETTPFDHSVIAPEQTRMDGFAVAEKHPSDVSPSERSTMDQSYPIDNLDNRVSHSHQPVPEDDLTRQIEATDEDDLPF